MSVAGAFGIGHYASVATVVRRFKGLTADNAELARRVERIKRQFAVPKTISYKT